MKTIQEKALDSITRLDSDAVCDIAVELLDMNQPNPDRIHDIAERLEMGYDESTDEFLDFNNASLRVSHRRQIYAKNSRIFQLEEALKDMVRLFPTGIKDHRDEDAQNTAIQKSESLLNKE